MASSIKLVFEAVNNVSDAVKEIQTDLNGLENKVDIFKQASFANLATSLIDVGVAVSAFLEEFGREGAKFTSMKQSYTDLVESIGLDSESLLADMKKASGGMISESELMLSANKAVLLQVADTSEEIQTLLQIAIARGRAFGLSASDAFDDIVTGLGRLSPLILDNLGIVINTQATYAKFAAAMGKTAEQLSDVEKKQALFNEIQKTSGSIVASNAKLFDSAQAALDRYDSAMKDLKETSSSLFTDEYIKGYVKYAEAIETVTATLKGQRTVITEYIEDLTRMYMVESAGYVAGTKLADSMEAQALLTERAQREADSYDRVLRVMASDANDAAAETAAQAENLAQFELVLQSAGGGMSTFASLAHSAGVEMADLDEYIKRVKSSMSGFNEQFSQVDSLAKSTANQVLGAAKRAIPLLGKDEALRILNDQLSTIDGITEGIKYQNLTAAELQLTYAEMADTLSAPFDDAMEANKAGQKAWNDSVKDAQKEYDQLKQKVEGVLSSALDPGVGVNPDEILEQLGLRPDAINENARRLADVAVKGWESPWAEYLKNEFPDLIGDAFSEGDIKGNAAELLRDFQDGLRPELLDKEKAKERVRRLLLGEQKIGELAEEITQELNNELGNSFASQSIASAAKRALGVGNSDPSGGSSSGEAFSSGMLDYIKGDDVGTKVVSALADQLVSDSNVARSYESGRVHGSSWGQGFLNDVGDNVPIELIDLLASLVTPGVQKNLNTQSSLTGAQ